MNFVGLDLSLNATGFAIYMTKLEKYYFTTIKPCIGVRDTDSKIENIRMIISKKIDIIRDEGIELVCIEEVPFMNRPGTNQLAELNAVIRNMLLRKRVRFCVINNMSWKKFVLGNGKVTKDAGIEWCKNKGIWVKNDNEADAVCLAYWGKSGGFAEKIRKELNNKKKRR